MTRSPITAAMDETDAKEWVWYTPTECVSKMERSKITNICSNTHIHYYPLYFFVSSLFTSPQKEIYLIFQHESGAGNHQKKRCMDHISTELTPKSKLISNHHGFKSPLYKYVLI